MHEPHSFKLCGRMLYKMISLHGCRRGAYMAIFASGLLRIWRTQSNYVKFQNGVCDNIVITRILFEQMICNIYVAYSTEHLYTQPEWHSVVSLCNHVHYSDIPAECIQVNNTLIWYVHSIISETFYTFWENDFIVWLHTYTQSVLA